MILSNYIEDKTVMDKTFLPLLGAHISISQGLNNAIIRGESIGCTCIQIFTGSNRQWKSKDISQQEADKFIAEKSLSKIQTVVAHSRYLINIGSPNNNTREKSIQSLYSELINCKKLKINYLILHPGAALESSIEDCISNIASGIDEVYSQEKELPKILLENSAGQGSCVGYKFEHLAKIKELAQHTEKLGVCFDTCHAFAAGYDFSNETTYKQMWQDFDKIIGLSELKTIHLNDSKMARGKKLDRHENIGEGKMGILPFKFMMNDPNLINIPKILETPDTSSDYLADYKKNIDLLKTLIK